MPSAYETIHELFSLVELILLHLALLAFLVIGLWRILAREAAAARRETRPMKSAFRDAIEPKGGTLR